MEMEAGDVWASWWWWGSAPAASLVVVVDRIWNSVALYQGPS
jgi:hypothetical protein